MMPLVQPRQVSQDQAALLEDLSVENRPPLNRRFAAPHLRNQGLVFIGDRGSHLGPVVPEHEKEIRITPETHRFTCIR